jgi:hypothetical protein
MEKNDSKIDSTFSSCLEDSQQTIAALFPGVSPVFQMKCPDRLGEMPSQFLPRSLRGLD